MKKIKCTILVLFLITATFSVFIACTKEPISNEPSTKSTLREAFLKNKEHSIIKDDFNALDKQSKIDLWNEKLNQLMNQKLPLQSKKLIKKLIIEFNKEKASLKAISEIAVELAKIIPEEDFNKMFFELSDYIYESDYKGKTKVSKETMFKLKWTNNNYDKNNKTNLTSKTKWSCNCDWTCDLYVGGYTSNCSPTQSGCGFLYAFACTYRVGPVVTPKQY